MIYYSCVKYKGTGLANKAPGKFSFYTPYSCRHLRLFCGEQETTKTWQFARRQYTWFRHQHPESEIITPDEIAEYINNLAE